MRIFAIVGLMCVGCATTTEEGSLFPEDVPASETKSAPMETPAEEEENPYAAWHHWSTIDIPAIADGLLELNVAETPDRPIAASQITVFDDQYRPIGSGYEGWFTASVAAGKRYHVDVYADPSKGEVRLLQSFKPVIDSAEPNDDIAHATTIAPGQRSEVHIFATHEKKVDTDYFRIVTKGKRSMRLFFANGSRSTTYCADVIADVTAEGSTPVGGTCLTGDLDASFLLPEHTGTVFVKLTGPSTADTGALTVTVDY